MRKSRDGRECRICFSPRPSRLRVIGPRSPEVRAQRVPRVLATNRLVKRGDAEDAEKARVQARQSDLDLLFSESSASPR